MIVQMKADKNNMAQTQEECTTIVQEEVTSYNLEALIEKDVQVQTRGRGLGYKFHSLAKVVKGVHSAQVAWDEPHVSVGGMLGTCLTWRKGLFLGDKANFGEEQLAGKETRVMKSHMQRRKACKSHLLENLTTLGLGFLKSS